MSLLPLKSYLITKRETKHMFKVKLWFSQQTNICITPFPFFGVRRMEGQIPVQRRKSYKMELLTLRNLKKEQLAPDQARVTKEVG